MAYLKYKNFAKIDLISLLIGSDTPIILFL